MPVDWYYNKKTPTLHIGLPCEYCDYADHETTYDKKIVAGEEDLESYRVLQYTKMCKI